MILPCSETGFSIFLFFPVLIYLVAIIILIISFAGGIQALLEGLDINGPCMDTI